MRKLLIFIIVLFGISVVHAQEETPEPLPIVPIPMSTDELIALTQVVQESLASQDTNWYLTLASNNATNTKLTWFQSCCSGIVVIEEVRVCCKDSIATYFSYSEDMLPFYQLILANLAPFELVQMCELDNVRIHEFLGTSNGVPYYIRHYHEDFGQTVHNTGLYFTSPEKLEIYSELFFPEMSGCPDNSTEVTPETTEESG